MLTKHFIIPIFIPHLGCPHQCVFCNQNSITGLGSVPSADQVRAELSVRLAAIDRPRHVEAAFYGGSFTCLPETMQAALLAPATELWRQNRLQGIRLSTRPDAMDEATAIRLAAAGVTEVELGVQSMDDSVLRAAERGHDSSCVAPAIAALKMAGITVGVQLMLGLPGQTYVSALETARLISELVPSFARIYPVIVLAGTTLDLDARQGRYQPLSLTEAVRQAAGVKLALAGHGIPVIRTGLQATMELDNGTAVSGGPYHPAFGEMVDSELFYQMIARVLDQQENSRQGISLTILHHPRDTSKVRGLNRRNMLRLCQRYQLTGLELIPHGYRLGWIELRLEKISVTTGIFSSINK